MFQNNVIKNNFSSSIKLQSRETFEKLFKETQELSPFYHKDTLKYLSTHLDMNLIALLKLNATPQQLNNYYDQYLQERDIKKKAQINEAKDSQIVDKQTFLQQLNKYELYESYLYFLKDVEYKQNKKSLNEIINEYIPILYPGIGSEAYHCVIKIAYGLDHDNQAEQILQGLAYLASAQALFPNEYGKSKDKGIFETLEEIHKQQEYFKKITHFDEPRVFNDKIIKLQIDDKFQDLVPNHFIIEGSFEEHIHKISLFLIKLFIETDNFLILHTVTGFYATKRLLKQLEKEEDKILVVDCFLKNVSAAYAIGDFIKIQNREKLEKRLQIPKNLSEWEEIINKANNSYDDHDNKLTYICKMEYNYLKENGYDENTYNLYRYAAAIQTKLLE
ncbi:hypothetical protein PPERSA_11305 [Pseudocohnilembus persalinus]|uniref:Uncharacterized protein n=1 Tax=Pseudocohnilembus persalinus TaxID=266149 RepID=A0A0V0QQE3_PSEPJ|nr:hypothetical protein PPERSA_11305 [Pseudocohnilembus persalinus]|eukprot:KRX04181.1 hypothetical protein PPERSA_11305 [Pseudocohnilembus persalinus]